MLHAGLVSTGSTAGHVDRQTGLHHSARETNNQSCLSCAELVSTGSAAGRVDRQTGHHHSAGETQDLWAGLRFPPHPQQQVSGC